MIYLNYFNDKDNTTIYLNRNNEEMLVISTIKTDEALELLDWIDEMNKTNSSNLVFDSQFIDAHMNSRI